MADDHVARRANANRDRRGDLRPRAAVRLALLGRLERPESLSRLPIDGPRRRPARDRLHDPGVRGRLPALGGGDGPGAVELAAGEPRADGVGGRCALLPIGSARHPTEPSLPESVKLARKSGHTRSIKRKKSCLTRTPSLDNLSDSGKVCFFRGTFDARYTLYRILVTLRPVADPPRGERRRSLPNVRPGPRLPGESATESRRHETGGPGPGRLPSRLVPGLPGDRRPCQGRRRRDGPRGELPRVLGLPPFFDKDPSPAARRSSDRAAASLPPLLSRPAPS